MLFKPFYPGAHGDAVLEMLKDYIDYTPFDENPQESETSIYMFEDAHIDESCGDAECVGISDDDPDCILGFLNADKKDDDGPCWFISELFIKRNADSDTIAKAMVEQFIQFLKEEGAIKNIRTWAHPASQTMVSFWQALGFVEKPLIRRVNAKNQKLVVMEKAIADVTD